MAGYSNLQSKALYPLKPGESAMLAFRPKNVDPIFVRVTYTRKKGVPLMPIVPPEVALYRPEHLPPLGLEVLEPGIMYMYPMEAGDLDTGGDWSCWVTNRDYVEGIVELEVYYPGTYALQHGVLNFEDLTRSVRELLGRLKPRFHLTSGNFLEIDFSQGKGEPDAHGLREYGQFIDYVFQPGDLAAGDVLHFAAVGWPGDKPPKHHKKPGDPPSDSDDPWETEIIPFLRKIEIFAPGNPVPVLERTDSPVDSYITLADYTLQEGDPLGAVDWIARVTHLEPEVGPGTIGIGAASWPGSSSLELDPAAADEMGAPALIHFDAPKISGVTFECLGTRPGDLTYDVLFRHELPIGGIGFLNEFPLGELDLTIHTGPMFGQIYWDATVADGHVRISELSAGIRLGLGIRDGYLTFRSIQFKYDVDFDGGIDACVLDALSGALEFAGNFFFDELGAGAQLAIGKIIAKAFPPGARIFSASADVENIYFDYFFPQEETPPKGRTPAARAPGYDQIDHLVVVIMENRSFDHMLGYLSLNGRKDVNGLTGKEKNKLRIPSEKLGDYAAYAGKTFRVHPLPDTLTTTDLKHGWRHVAQQLGDRESGYNSGFVDNYVAEELIGGRIDGGDPSLPMGYHTGDQVYVYDFLARNYTICDRWFCSLPGPTQPNRAYAFAGTSGGGGKNSHSSLFNVVPVFKFLEDADVDWRFYYHNVASLGLIAGWGTRHDKVRFADDPEDSFWGRAASGTLPPVTFLDPSLLAVPSSSEHNDDHPPCDILPGQEFIGKVYQALSSSPAWERTLLLVTYDEHGGFYDHVQPPPSAPDDYPETAKFGVRVPTFLVSPRVPRRFVSKVLYDHASIVKSILLRFCYDNGTIPDLGARVRAANDIGPLLIGQAAGAAVPDPWTVPSAARSTKPLHQPDTLEPGDWRAWIEEAAAPDVRHLPRPLIGMSSTSLAFDRGMGLPMGGGSDVLAALRAQRAPVNLIRLELFVPPKAIDLPGDRAIPLFEGEEVSPEFLDHLVQLVDTGARQRPRFWFQICLLSRAALETPSMLPDGLPDLLRPDYKKRLRARLQDWFDPHPSRRLEAQKRLVRSIAERLRHRRHVIWEIVDQAAIAGRGSRPGDNAALVRWLEIMAAEIRAAAGPSAYVTTGTGHFSARPVNGTASESTVLGQGNFATRLMRFGPRQWVDHRSQDRAVRSAMRRAAGYGGADARVLCLDDGATGPREERIRAVLRQGAGYIACGALPSTGGPDEPLLQVLRGAVRTLSGRERTWLAVREPDVDRSVPAPFGLQHFTNFRPVGASGWIFTSRMTEHEILLSLAALSGGDVSRLVCLDALPGASSLAPAEIAEWLRTHPLSQGGSLVLEGIEIPPDRIGALLKYLNSASEVSLRGLGIGGRAVGSILGNRPFPSLEAFAAAPQIGAGTIRRVRDGVT